MNNGKKALVMASIMVMAVFSAVAITSAPVIADADTETDARTTSIVSTRGHFEISWGDVDLTDGHTPTDYDTTGDVPGLEAGSCPSDLTVFIHGWRNDAGEAVESFDQVKRAMRQNGYGGPVVGYSWDSDTSWYEWYSAEEIAQRNGKKLAAFTTDYKQRCPNTRLHYVAHSLGGQVVMSTLENLHWSGEWNSKIDSVHMLGTAVENEAASYYGDRAGYLSVYYEVRDFHNYYKTDDDILQWLYSIAEFDNALGEEGADGYTPPNYNDHDVTDQVPDHFSYDEPGEGVINLVVRFL